MAIINFASIDRTTKQRCKICWNSDGFDFHVPDNVWIRVVPEHLQNSVVCLSCFDELAFNLNIEYGKYISVIYFAGIRLGFSFKKE